MTALRDILLFNRWDADNAKVGQKSGREGHEGGAQIFGLPGLGGCCPDFAAQANFMWTHLI